MRKTVWRSVLAAVVSVGVLTGCGPSGRCGECSDSSDCVEGLTCQEFRTDDGRRYDLCGTNDPYETCSITEYY